MDPCSSGVDLQELKKFFCPWTKGGTSVNSFFQCGPPFDSRVEIFLSSWRSRPPEHGSTHHGEAWTIQIFHVLTFDLIKLAKIGLCPPPSGLSAKAGRIGRWLGKNWGANLLFFRDFSSKSRNFSTICLHIAVFLYVH